MGNIYFLVAIFLRERSRIAKLYSHKKVALKQLLLGCLHNFATKFLFIFRGQFRIYSNTMNTIKNNTKLPHIL